MLRLVDELSIPVMGMSAFELTQWVSQAAIGHAHDLCELYRSKQALRAIEGC